MKDMESIRIEYNKIQVGKQLGKGWENSGKCLNKRGVWSYL